MNEDKNNQPSPPPPPIVAPQNPQPNPNLPQQYPVSASQMGLTQPTSKFFEFNLKKLIVPGLIGVSAIIVLLFVLVYANVIALSQFKTISYDNSKGENYKLKFYSKHSSQSAKSGTKQLVSKVSSSGKFPLTLSISSSNINNYDRLRDCVGFSKAFDVQNNKLNQKISVCNAIDSNFSGQSTKDSVYIAGFTQNDLVHVITISQDYGDIDLSSASGAQESLKRFGMDVYKEDIEKIVSSVSVK